MSTSTGSAANFTKLLSSAISIGVAVWLLYQLGVFGSSESTPVTPTQHIMGETFDVGYWRYSIDRVTTGPQLGRGYGAEKADGRFVVVHLTVENNSKDASTLPSPILKDSLGREHSAKAVLGQELPGDDLFIQTLNPGIFKQGYFVFDVPPDVVFIGALRIILSGGYQSKETASVPLVWR